MNTKEHIERLDRRIDILTHVIKVLSKGHKIPYILKPFYVQKDGARLGDLMTCEDFSQCVENGTFIDYDGHGYFCTAEMQSDILVTPSTFHFLWPCVEWRLTYIIWFNK